MLLHKNKMTNKYFLCSCYNINMNTDNEGKLLNEVHGNGKRLSAISNINLSFRIKVGHKQWADTVVSETGGVAGKQQIRE